MVQMITSMRRCVAHDDLWPWPISSRSFGLDLENRVLSVASTVLDGFFPYLVQMITSMRRCVACDDLWPWPISSRSFGVDLENRVLSVASTVLDGFFPYLVQMITSMRRCVACNDLWPWPISSRSFDLDFENRVCSVTFSVLDRLFFSTWDPIVWVIMRRRGVSSERRRSSCSSLFSFSHYNDVIMGVISNQQPHDCLLNRLFRRRSKKTSKLRVTGLCAGNSPGTGEFPAQMASNAENVSIWCRHGDGAGSWNPFPPNSRICLSSKWDSS